jgi:NAD+ kinase
MPVTTTRPRALLVYKKSMYQLYTVDRRVDAIDRLIAAHDPGVSALHAAHEAHSAALRTTDAALRAAGYEVSRTYRAGLDVVADFDLVVTVGGDGTLLNVSHHVGPDIPLLGVNSDPARSVGLLMAASANNVAATLDAIRSRRLRPYHVARLALDLNGERLPTLALNDALIAHSNPAATSRYLLTSGRQREKQKSSGIWIASAIGSSAALFSAGGTVQPIDDSRLQFVVREPYGGGKPLSLRGGLLPRGCALIVHSAMRGGRIYLDGPHTWHDFGLGSHLVVRALPRSLALFLAPDNLARRNAIAKRKRPRPAR